MSDKPEADDLEKLFGPADKPQLANPEVEEVEGESEEESVVSDSRPQAYIPPPARAALQRFMSRGVLLSRTHSDEFGQLMAWRNVIQSILASMGLRMHISADYGMAVLMRGEDMEAVAAESDDDEGGDEDEESSVSLVRTSRLKLLHSLVLMVLRMYYRERERAGDEQIIIDLESLKDRLKPYWPLLNAEGRSDKHFNGAIRKLQESGVLLKVRGKEDQRCVSPVIVLVLDSEKLETMVKEYARLAGVPSQETTQHE